MNNDYNPFISLIETTHWVASKGWSPATGGNYSTRLSDGNICITASGRDKSSLTMQDLITVDLEGTVLFAEEGARPSAETRLHTRLYQLDSDIGAVLHSHSVNATVLSRSITKKWWKISGYEMQKSLEGNSTHDEEMRVWIVDNDQDMDALADTLATQWEKAPLQWGLLVRGHGLYAWGQNLTQARRHLEGLEFLMACDMTARSSRS